MIELTTRQKWIALVELLEADLIIKKQYLSELAKQQMLAVLEIYSDLAEFENFKVRYHNAWPITKEE